MINVCGLCPELAPINRLLELTTQSEALEACPICKTKRSDVKKTGIVGCPVCYEIFDSNIREILGQN